MQMVAEIIFLEPDDVNPAVSELAELGFDCEVLHWDDPLSEATWILARIDSELDVDGVFGWAKSIIGGIGGDLVEAGVGDAAFELDLERKHRDNERLYADSAFTTASMKATILRALPIGILIAAPCWRAPSHRVTETACGAPLRPGWISTAAIRTSRICHQLAHRHRGASRIRDC